jgi:hypothetical protein
MHCAARADRHAGIDGDCCRRRPECRACANESRSEKCLRIGYQKYGTLTVLKGSASLEKRLAPLGVEVKWTEFPAGRNCWKV